MRGIGDVGCLSRGRVDEAYTGTTATVGTCAAVTSGAARGSGSDVTFSEANRRAHSREGRRRAAVAAGCADARRSAADATRRGGRRIGGATPAAGPCRDGTCSAPVAAVVASPVSARAGADTASGTHSARAASRRGRRGGIVEPSVCNSRGASVSTFATTPAVTRIRIDVPVRSIGTIAAGTTVATAATGSRRRGRRLDADRRGGGRG